MKQLLTILLMFWAYTVQVYSYVRYIALKSMIVQSRHNFRPLLTIGAKRQIKSPIAHETVGWNESFYDHFLSNYWQKRPLLIRQAFPIGFLNHANSSTLLDLAANDDVESRLFTQVRRKFQKEYGPFESEFIKSLPAKNWTILLQEVDRHLPSVAALWDTSFPFIPEWRRDDIMISYATPGGGIGGHVDNYDVFLIQGRGMREWSIENNFITADEESQRQVPNVHTKLIRNFCQGQSWTLTEGDMLYLPPRLPHQGVSLSDECVTISLGFRSPSYRSMVTALCETICNNIPEDAFYEDLPIKNQRMYGSIDSSISKNIANNIKKKINNVLYSQESINEWLGSYLSSPLRLRRKPSSFFLNSIIENVNEETLFQDNILYPRGDESLEEDQDLYADEDDEDDEDVAQIQLPKNASKRIFDSCNDIIEAVRRNEIALHRIGGLKVIHDEHDKIFINGKVFTFPMDNDIDQDENKENENDKKKSLSDKIFFNFRVLLSDNIEIILADKINSERWIRLLKYFIQKGFYYPIDIHCS